jgi:hypothetical protein
VGESEDVGVGEGVFDSRDVGDVMLASCGKAAAITRAGFRSTSKSRKKYIVRRAILDTGLVTQEQQNSVFNS